MRGADLTGDVHTAADDAVPQPLGGFGERGVARQTCDMRQTGAQIGHAHGMAVRIMLIGDWLGRLIIGAREIANHRKEVTIPAIGAVLLIVEVRILPSDVEEPSAHRGVPLLTGGLGQAGERKFDLRVAIGPMNLRLAIAEILLDARGHPPGDAERLLIAGGLPISHGRLDVMAHHIQLMRLLDALEDAIMLLDLEERVQVAVLTLGASDEIHHAIRQTAQLRIAAVMQCVGHGFQPLVDVRILERHAAERRVLLAGGHPQVADRMVELVIGINRVAARIRRQINLALAVENRPLIRQHLIDNQVDVPPPERRGNLDVGKPGLGARTLGICVCGIHDELLSVSLLPAPLPAAHTHAKAISWPTVRTRTHGRTRPAMALGGKEKGTLCLVVWLRVSADQPLTAPAVKPLT